MLHEGTLVKRTNPIRRSFSGQSPRTCASCQATERNWLGLCGRQHSVIRGEQAPKL